MDFAKFIYQILGKKWGDREPIQFQTLQESFKKANSEDKKILYLVYGSVGIL